MTPKKQSLQLMFSYVIIAVLLLYIAADKGYIVKDWTSTNGIAVKIDNNVTKTKTTTTTTTTTTATTPPPAYSPCTSCYVYDLSKNFTGQYPCVTMKFKPPASICLYPTKKDIFVSGSLQRSGTWEAGMVNKFQSWLREHPGSGVLDIGANLGVYSLVAAAMGRDVVSVEPNIENIRRYHKAIKMGHFENRVTLLQNAIGDSPGRVQIVYSKNNQGDTRMRQGNQGNTRKNNATDSRALDETKFAQIIYMDDLVRFCKFKTAIIKIDIQGFEHRAFAKAAFLFDKVDIVKVMMEWDVMRRIFQAKRAKPEEYQLVVNMIKFFSDRNFVAKDWGGKVLQNNKWNVWPFDVVWHRTDPEN